MNVFNKVMDRIAMPVLLTVIPLFVITLAWTYSIRALDSYLTEVFTKPFLL